jgi:hypothetical protein
MAALNSRTLKRLTLAFVKTTLLNTRRNLRAPFIIVMFSFTASLWADTLKNSISKCLIREKSKSRAYKATTWLILPLTELKCFYNLIILFRLKKILGSERPFSSIPISAVIITLIASNYLKFSKRNTTSSVVMTRVHILAFNVNTNWNTAKFPL